MSRPPPTSRVSRAISRERFHILELDGLCFLAFLSVFVTHAIPARFHPIAGTFRWWADNALFAGALGLDLFFVLSGFLITSLLLGEHDQQGHIDVRAFWIRRMLRIWPLPPRSRWPRCPTGSSSGRSCD